MSEQPAHEVSSLDDYRIATGRRRPVAASATVYFNIASPYSYLAVERIERMFSDLHWQPAHAAELPSRMPADVNERAALAARAEQLKLPIVWPSGSSVAVVAAMRVASLAIERGRGAEFVIAASRLVFCGGYDIEEPEILMHAAEVADINFSDMLRAASDRARDDAIADTGHQLVAAGAKSLPALHVRGELFCGEDRLTEAASTARATA